MKKIIIFIGSRRKYNSNTYKFICQIIRYIQQRVEINVEFVFPDTYSFGEANGSEDMFQYAKDCQNDQLQILINKIIESDFFILASPVYAHAVSSDTKKLIDRLSYWSHLLMLAGQGSAVFSTNMSNGHNSVIDYLSNILTAFGSYVAVKYNVSTHVPPELDDVLYMEAVCKTLGMQIISVLENGVQVLEQHERLFTSLKEQMLYYKEKGLRKGEWQYWENKGYIECDSFNEVIDLNRKGE